MALPYIKAPHQGALGPMGPETVHAALLIDFDNVTMGMRSDLSKELKTLLDSDVIKGKVSVQRAYADWRRYPQYIVPLSEASVDLIFAPAYGSNKKNATDIRMAIDGMELVFVRPEIGTYILLTGDSDFSSLVLKLKEYGKYVIGVGIQESSSDILVQNCDEYYSYTSLTGLQKTTSGGGKAGQDPWGLVTKALDKMVSRDDVMRSDRLKQVMQEIEPNFDEGAVGFSKFSKFMAEASSKGLVELKKMENGQYEVAPPSGRPSRGGGGGRSRRDRGRGRGGRERRERSESRQPTTRPSESAGGGDPLQDAYDLLVNALGALADGGRDRVRDSDVKRKMLALSPGFDEAELGFAKFSKFLAQATEDGAVDTDRTQRGNYEVSLPSGGPDRSEEPAQPEEEPEVFTPAEDYSADDADEPQATDDALQATDDGSATDYREPDVVEIGPSDFGGGHRGFGPRGGSTRRRGGEDEVPLFEGQVVTSTPMREERRPAPSGGGGDFDASGLGLPTDPEAIVRYMTHRYKGVGEKTAQTLVERYGAGVFQALRDDPAGITSVIPASRADQVLEAWGADYERRMESQRARGGN